MKPLPPSPLAARRIALGLTQRQLAERIGRVPQYVQKLEYGTIELKNITFERAAQLAAALELTLDQLAEYMV